MVLHRDLLLHGHRLPDIEAKGLAFRVLRFGGWRCGYRLAVGFGNRVWGNETVMTYLKMGLYRYWLPPAGRIKWKVRAC